MLGQRFAEYVLVAHEDIEIVVRIRRLQSRLDSRQAVDFAHAHGVRVHVTVNTMPRCGEIKALPAWLELLSDAGVDALITADLGTFTLAGKYALRCERHVSTQVSVANHVSARAWYELGPRL